MSEAQIVGFVAHGEAGGFLILQKIMDHADCIIIKSMVTDESVFVYLIQRERSSCMQKVYCKVDLAF